MCPIDSISIQSKVSNIVDNIKLLREAISSKVSINLSILCSIQDLQKQIISCSRFKEGSIILINIVIVWVEY